MHQLRYAWLKGLKCVFYSYNTEAGTSDLTLSLSEELYQELYELKKYNY